MQLSLKCNLASLFKEDDGILTIDGATLLPETKQYTVAEAVLDPMGEKSAKAQGLHGSITSAQKLAANRHICYVAVAKGNVVLGILKTGTKFLSVYDRAAQIHQRDFPCVLDFYVCEECQRQGVGRSLFDFMLEHERLEPSQIAYDRPSPKLLGFLQRHFGLVAHVDQPNSYVVFDEYFAASLSGSVRGEKVFANNASPLYGELGGGQRFVSKSHLDIFGSNMSPPTPAPPERQPAEPERAEREPQRDRLRASTYDHTYRQIPDVLTETQKTGVSFSARQQELDQAQLARSRTAGKCSSLSTSSLMRTYLD